MGTVGRGLGCTAKNQFQATSTSSFCLHVMSMVCGAGAFRKSLWPDLRECGRPEIITHPSLDQMEYAGGLFAKENGEWFAMVGGCARICERFRDTCMLFVQLWLRLSYPVRGLTAQGLWLEPATIPGEKLEAQNLKTRSPRPNARPHFHL